MQPYPSAPRSAVRSSEPISGILIKILGQCSTKLLSQAIDRCPPPSQYEHKCSQGNYKEILTGVQSLLTLPNPDFLILLPWIDLYELGEISQQWVEEYIEFWKKAWAIGTKLETTRMIQIGIDFPFYDPRNSAESRKTKTQKYLLQKLQRKLCRQLPKGVTFVDLEGIASDYGRERFYDFPSYLHAKQPFAKSGAEILAKRLLSLCITLKDRSKKAILLSGDHTLWRGQLSSLGPLGVDCGPWRTGIPYRYFQLYLKQLRRTGVPLILNADCNLALVREAFQHNRDFVLKWEDFEWISEKSNADNSTIPLTEKKLNLPSHSLVLFETNKKYRESLRENHPNCDIVSVPTNPSRFIRALDQHRPFLL